MAKQYISKQDIILKITNLTKLTTDIRATVANNPEVSDLLISKKNLLHISNEIESVVQTFINLFDDADVKI